VKFRNLTIGQSFDFVDAQNPLSVSFWDRCVKISKSQYRSLNSGYVYTVGTVNVAVFNQGVA
jgi:hypothetical protein